tara:strand:- start:4051 stop:5073 length:1023 start_codon:yes stop_codon:yes gene_type:complete
MRKMHGIAQTTNGQMMTAWTGNTPWHNLGQQAKGLMTSAEALEMAHLDWKVEKLPLWAVEEDGNPVRVPDTFGVFRRDEDDNLIPLSRGGKSVGRVWTALQNEDAFAFMDDLMQTQEAKIEVCGALGNGEKVWLLARMPQSVVIGGSDEVNQFILISNTHDGSGAVKILQTPIRVVCQNTLTWALNQGRGQGYNIRHTRTMMDRVDLARQALGMVNTDFLRWGEMADGMLNTQMTMGEMETYFIDVLGIEKDEEGNLKTRGRNLLESVQERLYEDTNNVGSMTGTVWQAYNTITEAIDHDFTRLADGKVSQKRQESALFGALAKKKQVAWNKAMLVVGGQ